MNLSTWTHHQTTMCRKGHPEHPFARILLRSKSPHGDLQVGLPIFAFLHRDLQARGANLHAGLPSSSLIKHLACVRQKCHPTSVDKWFVELFPQSYLVYLASKPRHSS